MVTLARVPPVDEPGDDALRELLEPVVREFSAHRPDDDPSTIEAAGRASAAAHAEQYRRSGEPYVTHPIAVAAIVAELGLDAPTVVAALLHDAVEDTGLTLESIEAQFGPVVARVVDGVTKLDRLQFDTKEAQQAATIRKMLVAMASDWRVLLIKLADRLHNMRTLAVMPEWKQHRTAQETFDVYAPLAHRLGVQQVKWQLEDLAFATLHPKRYAEIEQMVAVRAPQREEYLARVLVSVRERLAAAGLEAEVTGPSEAPVEHLREDGRAGQGVRRHPRPGRDPGGRGPGEGLLVGPRGHPRHLAAGPGPLQGLHQHPEVQPLPVVAHDGDRARRQADRGAGPHDRDAPAGRVRDRRPLGLQGEGGRLLRDGLAAADRRRRSRDLRPGRVPRGPEARPRAGRGLRLHPEGQGDRPAGPVDAGRLRLRHPHRGRAPLHRGPGQRPAGAARHPAQLGRHGRDLHLEGPDRRPVPGLAEDRRPRPGPATRSGSGSAGSGARTPSRPVAKSWPGRSAARACRCRRCSGPTPCSRWPSR